MCLCGTRWLIREVARFFTFAVAGPKLIYHQANPMSNLKRLSSDPAYAPVPLFVTLVANELTLYGSTILVGVDDMLLDLPEKLPERQAVLVVIELINRDNESIPVECTAECGGYEGYMLRIENIEYANATGRENVRNLVLLHAQDPGQAARDIPRA